MKKVKSLECLVIGKSYIACGVIMTYEGTNSTGSLLFKRVSGDAFLESSDGYIRFRQNGVILQGLRSIDWL